MQPWATLVVIGAKKIETRSWNTKYRGPLLIHASKKMTRKQKDLCKQKYFKDALRQEEELPLGAIVGSVTLVETIKTDQIMFLKGFDIKGKRWELSNQELSFGNYTEGRLAWALSDHHKFQKHLFIKGSLSVWDFDARICRQCGCTDKDACLNEVWGPCSWREEDLCSHCYMINNKLIRPESVKRLDYQLFQTI